MSNFWRERWPWTNSQKNIWPTHYQLSSCRHNANLGQHCVTNSVAFKTITSWKKTLHGAQKELCTVVFGCAQLSPLHSHHQSDRKKYVNCTVNKTQEEKKHGALHPEKPWRFIRTGKLGGQEFYIKHLLNALSPPEWFCIKVGICLSHSNTSFIVWAKSQDSVHKPHFLKRKQSRSGSNRGPSAYQPSALPLGHTCSQLKRWTSWHIYSLTNDIFHAFNCL